ncbi:hypothetical protein [Paracidovorax cattleyae]|uniref:Uncharacterized protein n=1 Tax=Paracidovorax cattleyae TaxID=80868 RepID=A0A1H0WDB9_9BURK|nr:hypothetical protein [Paracidovorax cattleyae]SDP88779.1 hypothetical protein SAMN04489708_13651 [Paracidovorax cattleyae]
MFFLTYVMAQDAGGLRVILPDFDLQASAAAVVEVPDRLQEAIAQRYEGNAPKSSRLEDLQADERFRDGWWLWLNIDVDDLGRRRRKRKTERAAAHRIRPGR